MRLALLPGLGGTGRLFAPLLNRLPPSLDPLVIRYPTADANSLDRHIEVAAQALSSDGPWLLLAESFSGPIAARLATGRSDLNIAGVIFCASFLSSPRPYALALLKHAPLGRLFGIRPPDWFIRAACMGGRADPDLIAELRLALATTGSEALAHRLRLLAGLPPFEQPISQPCLYIRPRQDRLVPRRCVAEVQRLCRRLRVATLEGPHFILQTEPEACAGLIGSFADGLDPRTAQESSMQSEV